MSALLLGCRAARYPSTASFHPVLTSGDEAALEQHFDVMVLMDSDEAADRALDIAHTDDRVALGDRRNHWSMVAFPFARLEPQQRLVGCTCMVNWTASGAKTSTTRGEMFVNGIGFLQPDPFDSPDLAISMTAVDLWRYRLGVSGLFAAWDRSEITGDLSLLSVLSGMFANPEKRDRGAGLKRPARAFVDALSSGGWRIG